MQAITLNDRYTFFPEIEPYETGFLRVSAQHEIYYEAAGNPQGQPVLVLHGGPGGGIIPRMRQTFDPEHYRILLFDQRGAGKSRPHAGLEANTTWDLVADIEALRQHWGVEQWLIFGGSWGSTLALAYAVTHPERVQGLILRGIFLGRPQDIHWLYQYGASELFPEAFEGFKAPVTPEQRHNLVEAYYPLLTSADMQVRIRAAQAWSVWEAAISKLIPDPQLMEDFDEPEFALAFARIECHYFAHNCFFQTHNYLLEQAHRLKGIPGVIVHGRYDVVCKAENAWSLHQAWPESELIMVPDAGHSGSEPGTLHALIDATERFKR